MRRRAEAAIDDARPGGDWFSQLHLRLVGGAQLIVVGRKTSELPEGERPAMAAIDPATLVIGEDEMAGYTEFPTVLREAASRLTAPMQA